MQMKRDEVRWMCERIGPAWGFDPLLVLAVCEQESGYDFSAVRLENGFYRSYTKKMEFETPVEILFAASYGLMQLMGLSLHELRVFPATDSATVVAGLNVLIGKPDMQIEFGCAWLTVKRLQAQGHPYTIAVGRVKNMLALSREGRPPGAEPLKDDVLRNRMLGLYNGDVQKYPPEVLAKYATIVKAYRP